MTMQRREFLKLTSAAALGIALTPKLAFPRELALVPVTPPPLMPPVEQEAVKFVPMVEAEEVIDFAAPRSLANIFFVDQIPKGKKPLYSVDVRSTPQVIFGKAGRTPLFRSPIDHRKVCLYPFNAHLSAEEEDRDVIDLLDASCNMAHTVTCVGGGLNMTGLDESMRTIECHYQNNPNIEASEVGKAVQYMILHPDLIPQFEKFWGKETYKEIFERHLNGSAEEDEELGFIWHVREQPAQEIRSKGEMMGWTRFRPAIERHIMILSSKQMHKDRVYFTSKPEYLGVYAALADGRIGMAILNDYSVACCRIQEEEIPDFETSYAVNVD